MAINRSCVLSLVFAGLAQAGGVLNWSRTPKGWGCRGGNPTTINNC